MAPSIRYLSGIALYDISHLTGSLAVERPRIRLGIYVGRSAPVDFLIGRDENIRLGIAVQAVAYACKQAPFGKCVEGLRLWSSHRYSIDCHRVATGERCEITECDFYLLATIIGKRHTI